MSVSCTILHYTSNSAFSLLKDFYRRVIISSLQPTNNILLICKYLYNLYEQFIEITENIAA